MMIRRILVRACILAVLWQWTTLAAETCAGIVKMRPRRYVFSIRAFGGVGDGQTLNTEAFATAISRILQVNERTSGGCMLYIPSGVWLTGPFNLTSHMTLFLAKNAVMKASQDTSLWPLIAPLPSYGRGRERPGGRYMSFIHADSVEDLTVTGNYGTIDGQGEVWWNMWRDGSLQYTRGNLIEIMNSRDVIISNLVLSNSPFWTVHPVYSSNVVVKGLYITAPQDSPNTDGIDPDSSDNVCIEDCKISNGDDMVAIKSGWDEYGIAFGRPSSNIVIRRVRGQTRGFSGIAVGSETSGGVSNVLVQDVHVHDSAVGLHLKTNVGRGGVVRNITVSGLTLSNVRTAIRFSADTGGHPDDGYNRSALPLVQDIAVMHVVGTGIRTAGAFQGLDQSPMSNLCLFNISLQTAVPAPASPWHCSNVIGNSAVVSPAVCPDLQNSISKFCDTSYRRPH